MSELLGDLAIWQRVGIILVAAVCAHGLVRLVRWLAAHAMGSAIARRTNKARTVVSLLASTAVFALYFGAIGFALSEMGVSLTTYLASASIIGLAVAFGSQGIVQDVVSGLTIVFTDLFDIDDVVEISGQVGVVEGFGMRFTTLRSPLGAHVSIPNRSITNVVAYPRGYLRCLVDVVLPADDAQADGIEAAARTLTEAATEQFPGILRAPPEVLERHQTSSGKRYLRIKFRIWPGRGAPLEGLFRQELIQMARRFSPDYADWMVSVGYEVERYSAPRHGPHWRTGPAA